MSREKDGNPFSHALSLQAEADGQATAPVAPSQTASVTKTKKQAKSHTQLSPEEKFIREASLENILPMYKASALSRMKWNVKNGEQPKLKGRFREEVDVLFGRGNLIGQNPGNVFMRKVIHLNQAYYRATNKEHKQVAADAIIWFLESRGTRFLEPKDPKLRGNAYFYAPYERVAEKIMQALREKNTYRTGLKIPSALSSDKTSGSTKLATSRSSQRVLQMLSTMKDPCLPKNTAVRKGEEFFAMKNGNPMEKPIGKAKPKKTAKKQKTVVKAKQTSKVVKRTVPTRHSSPQMAAVVSPSKVTRANSHAPPSDDFDDLPMEVEGPKKTRRTTSREKKTESVKTRSKAKGPPPAWANVKIGDRLGIYWELDKIYYPGTVEAVDESHVHVLYDDGEREIVDLAANKFFRWKEGLNKRLRPPVPSNAESSSSLSQKSSSSSVPALKTSSDGSARTQVSTEAGKSSLTNGSSNENVQGEISTVFEGTFTKPIAVQTLSLENYLRRKLQQKQAAARAAVAGAE